MRLLITVGYQHLLFDKDIDIGVVINAFSRAQLVEEKGPYSKRVWAPCEKSDGVQLKLLPDEESALMENVKDPESMELLIKGEEERSKLSCQIYELKQTIEQLTKKQATPTAEVPKPTASDDSEVHL